MLCSMLSLVSASRLVSLSLSLSLDSYFPHIELLYSVLLLVLAPPPPHYLSYRLILTLDFSHSVISVILSLSLSPQIQGVMNSRWTLPPLRKLLQFEHVLFFCKKHNDSVCNTFKLESARGQIDVSPELPESIQSAKTCCFFHSKPEL